MPYVVVVEVFADICCTFTHVGLHTLSRARAERGLEGCRFHVRAWPLEWVNGHLPAPAAMRRQADALREQIAPGLFARFDPDALPSTTIPALALAAAAYECGVERGEHVSLALRDELFEHGRDISDPRVLAAVAAAAGIELPAPEHGEALVRADYDEGRHRGVVGSPHFFTPDGDDFFCPSLQITKTDDGRLEVDVRPGVIDELLSRCAS